MNHSFTQDSYQIPIPRIFSSPKVNHYNAITQLNKTNELNQAINSKKKIIRTLISTQIGSCQYIKLNRRKPSVLLSLEKGMKKFLFGKNGTVIDQIPNLRNQLTMQENKKKESIFNTKINAGELTYLNYKENEYGLNQRMNIFKRNILQKSHYFNIKKDHHIVLNVTNKLSDTNQTYSNAQSIQNMKLKLKTQHSLRTRNTFKAFAPNSKMVNYLINKNKTNTETSSITNKETSIPNNTIYLNTNTNANKNNTEQSILSMTNYHNKPLKLSKANTMTNKPKLDNTTFLSPTKTTINTNNNNHNINDTYIKRLMIKRKILNKANDISQHQVKLEKRLFRIIDKAQRPERKMNFLKEDIETIFGTKTKKKKSKGQTKELYLKATQTKNDYRCMESTKADLLKLSDTINNMTDDMALGLADRLIEEYWKKSVIAKVDLVQVPEFIKKRKEKESKLLRNRILMNNEKMIHMKNELIQEKNQLMDIIERQKELNTININTI